MTDSRQDNGSPIAMTMLIIVLVAVLLFFGYGTLKAFDEGNPFTLFVLLFTILVFIGLVQIVKSLMKGG